MSSGRNAKRRRQQERLGWHEAPEMPSPATVTPITPIAVQNRLQAAAATRLEAQRSVDQLVVEAKLAGLSWGEIEHYTGTARQSLHRKYAHAVSEATQQGRRP